MRVDPMQFQDHRTLLLVHGYDETADDALEIYKLIYSEIEQLKDAEGNDLYDSVIGYLWPAGSDYLEYEVAKDNALELSPKMKKYLIQLSQLTGSLDILFHSLGIDVCFEALNYPPLPLTKKTIQNFYSFAAAINSDSIEKHHQFAHATENFQDLYVFHSSPDEVLQYFYTFAEWDEALGYEGVADFSKIASNIQLIDCSAFVAGHSDYFTALPLYRFINKQHLNQLPPPHLAKNVVILEDGSVEVIVQAVKEDQELSIAAREEQLMERLMLEEINEENVNDLDPMVQDYEEEFSVLTGKERNAQGKFELDVDWHAPNRGFYFVKHNVKVGFCIIHEEDGRFDVAEFYVVPSSRGSKIGEKMAHALFQRFRGPWQVRQIKGADRATQFWRKVISTYTHGEYVELE